MSELEKYLDHPLPDDGVQKKMDALPFMAEYRRKQFLIFLGLIGVFVANVIFYVFTKEVPPPKVVLVNEQNQTLEFNPVKFPNLSIATIQSLSQEVVQKMYNFNFLEYENQLIQAKGYFSPDGWKAYIDFFLKSDFLKSIKDNKLTVAATLTARPIIKSRPRKEGGIMSWNVVVPVVVTFSGDTPQQAQYFHVNLVVIQVPTEENPKGLGVLSLIATQVDQP